MTKLRLTLTYEYEADPKYYDTDVPADMARVDQEQMQDDPAAMIEMIQADLTGLPFELKVEPTDG